MKIAITTSAHDVRDPRVHLRMALGLAGRGYEVQLIGGFNDSSSHALFSERVAGHLDWFELTGLGAANKPSPASKFEKANIRLKRFREIWGVWEAQQPDLVIIMDPELAPMAHRWATRHDRRWILDLHEDGFDPYYPKNRLIRHLINYAFNHAHGIIWAFEPRSHHARLLQQNRSVTAQNYFPFALYERHKPAAGRLEHPDELNNNPSSPARLLYTGIIGKERGLHHMVRLIGDLRKMDLNVSGIIAGRCYQSGYLERLQKVTATLDIKKHVQLIGGNHFIDWFELQKLHQHAGWGYLIYPSDALNWYRPTKVYEYAAHRIPILASSVAEFKNLLQSYSIGRLVDSPSLQNWNPTITGQVKTVVAENSGDEEGFDLFNSRHTWESQLDNIEELIKAIG